MSNEFDTYQLIQRILRREASEFDQQKFDQLYTENATFKSLFDEERQINQAIKGLVVQEISSTISSAFIAEKERQSKQRNKKIGISIAVIALVSIIGFQIDIFDKKKVTSSAHNSTTTSTIEVTHLKPQEEPQKAIEVFPSLDNTIEPAPTKINPKPTPELFIDTLTIKNKNTILAKQEETQEPNIEIEEKPVLSPKLENPCDQVDLELEINKLSPCLFGGLGEIEVLVFGGKPPYQFTLNGKSEDVGLFNNLTAGEYEISIKDDQGCSSNGQLVVLKNSRCQSLPKAFNAGEEWLYDSNYEIVELKILSIMGLEIYTSTAENPSWKGFDTNGDLMKTGAYIFMISKNGQVIDKGNVTLVR